MTADLETGLHCLTIGAANQWHAVSTVPVSMTCREHKWACAVLIHVRATDHKSI